MKYLLLALALLSQIAYGQNTLNIGNATSNCTAGRTITNVSNVWQCSSGAPVVTLSTNYISGTGTAGVDNTAQSVVTIALAANSLTQNGDRIRIRAYWTGDTGTAITGTTTLNGVTVAATTDSGAATLQVTEAWLHYIDNTHANIIAVAGGALDTSISAVNVAGFS